MAKINLTSPMLVAIVLFTFARSSSASAFTERFDNQNITRSVEDLLSVDQGLGAKEIHVSTKKNVVTLSGTVTSVLASERAREIAESIKGVRAVINTLNVTPPARTDAEIQNDVIKALEMRTRNSHP